MMNPVQIILALATLTYSLATLTNNVNRFI